MTAPSNLVDNPKGALFQVLEEVRTGMLGIMDSGQHMQPMTHFVDAQDETLWFITSQSADLVRAVGMGAQAEYCVIDPEARTHASLLGPITRCSDRRQLEKLWSPAVGAWFEGGIDDPDVALLRLTLREAAVWTSSGGVLATAFEMLRAQVQPGHRPDVGSHLVFQLNTST